MLRALISLALVAAFVSCDGRTTEPAPPPPEPERLRFDRGLGSWPTVERVDGGQRVRFEFWTDEVGLPTFLFGLRLEGHATDELVDPWTLSGCGGTALEATIPDAVPCYRIVWNDNSLWLSNPTALPADDPWLALPEIAEPTLLAPLAERTFHGPGFVARLTIQPLAPDFRPIGALYTWRVTCSRPCRSAGFGFHTADGEHVRCNDNHVLPYAFSTLPRPRTLETPEAFTMRGLVLRNAIECSLWIDDHAIRIAPRLPDGIRVEAGAWRGQTTIVAGRHWRDVSASP